MDTLLKYASFAKVALILAIIAALFVFLWPGALTAVAGFSLYGLSIAALVGPSALLQTAAVAAIAFAAVHVAALAIDIVGGFFSLIKNCCCSPADETSDIKDAKPQMTNNRYDNSHVRMKSYMPPGGGQRPPLYPEPAGSYTGLYRQPPAYEDSKFYPTALHIDSRY